jgi:glycosyltransferase involved in cell wall biosynthesis
MSDSRRFPSGEWSLDRVQQSGSSVPLPRPVAGGTPRFPIVVHSHLRWSFVWQRPQQVHSRLARSHRVLFLEEPIRVADGERPRLQIEKVLPNVHVAQPHLSASAWETRESLERETRKLLRESLGGLFGRLFSGAVHWVYSPLLAFQIDAFRKPAAVVYDCMDELTSFAFAPPELREREARLLERADLVLAGGHELYLAKKDRHSNVHAFGCGVEFEHFAKAGEIRTLPDDLAVIPAPRLGYVGVVDERLDYALIEKVARENADWSVVLIGPVVKVDPASLPRLPNVHYLGARPYAVLPDYLAGFEVCLMPFAMNDASRYINPTKTLEYLSTGKPVVSTPVRDVVRRFSDVVHVADANSFAARIREILGGDRLDASRGLEIARASSWEETVAHMEALVAAAVHARAAKPGTGVVTPIRPAPPVRPTALHPSEA